MEDLFAIVRRNEVETMLHNARLTRDWPAADENRTEAERQIRVAMYRFAIGRMTDEERWQILEILRPCCPDMFFMQSPIEDQQPVLSPLDHEPHLSGFFAADASG